MSAGGSFREKIQNYYHNLAPQSVDSSKLRSQILHGFRSPSSSPSFVFVAPDRARSRKVGLGKSTSEAVGVWRHLCVASLNDTVWPIRFRFRTAFYSGELFISCEYWLVQIQSCAEKRDCFAKHQPGMAGCGWLQLDRDFLST